MPFVNLPDAQKSEGRVRKDSPLAAIQEQPGEELDRPRQIAGQPLLRSRAKNAADCLKRSFADLVQHGHLMHTGDSAIRRTPFDGMVLPLKVSASVLSSAMPG